MIAARLLEPSTWAGFGTLFQLLKAFLPNYSHVLDAASGLAASIAVAVPEQK